MTNGAQTANLPHPRNAEYMRALKSKFYQFSISSFQVTDKLVMHL